MTKDRSEFRNKIVRHLNEKVPNLQCPVCGHRHFELLDELTSINTQGDNPNVIHIGGRYVPAALIICKNCSHILQFAAIPIGLVQPPDPPKPQEGDDG